MNYIYGVLWVSCQYGCLALAICRYPNNCLHIATVMVNRYGRNYSWCINDKTSVQSFYAKFANHRCSELRRVAGES